MDLNTILNEVNDEIKENDLVKVNEKLSLTNKQLGILDKYQIRYNKLSDTSEIIFSIQAFLNEACDLDDEEYEELDSVAIELSEINYYNNTNK